MTSSFPSPPVPAGGRNSYGTHSEPLNSRNSPLTTRVAPFSGVGPGSGTASVMPAVWHLFNRPRAGLLERREDAPRRSFAGAQAGVRRRSREEVAGELNPGLGVERAGELAEGGQVAGKVNRDG